MNRKTNTDQMVSHIQYFKNSAWKADTFRNKELPSSVISITEDTDFNNMKDAQLANLSELLANSPKYKTPRSKSMTISQGTRSDSVRICPNRHFEQIKNDQTVNVNEVPVVLIDSDGQIIDARIKGGGLKDDFIKASIGKNLFISSLTELGRVGMPTAAAASIMLELPSDIKTKYDEATILDAIKKFTAGGTHVTVTYYETDSAENLGWNLHGSETA